MSEATRIPELFGSLVFNERTMEQYVPQSAMDVWRGCLKSGQPLPLSAANEIADAMKTWALEHGATHFTHWFQPLSGVTAEKHDSFINNAGGGRVMMDFSGKELVRGEPDASSFPNGGLRATFEARGYSAWDPTAFAFIKDGSLCIPTVFCSYSGDALDKKTPLLRSMAAVDRAAVRVLKLFGDDAEKVTPQIGAEQEYFLIDRELYLKRMDLRLCGRALFGAKPPKGQELDDHYFGAFRPRVAAYMKELDEELWKLGVLSKTKHNEVAPGQHEMAPIYTDANTASDQNQLVMETMKKVAERHNLVCLLHEKPFAGVNGSGKHDNWSLSTDTGKNLFKPGSTPRQNAQFLLFLAAFIKGVDDYQEFLRATVAFPGNDHRLGAQEAPPAVLSIFLGDELSAVVDSIINDTDFQSTGKRTLKIGVDSLPAIPQDNTDRNRTSPMAFTGNKFEFRMLGSSQSIASPNVVLNTIMADELKQFADRLEKAESFHQALQELLRDTFRDHQRIIFDGNGYDDDWVQEAKRRGLSNLRDTVDCMPAYIDEKNVALFSRFGILTPEEMHARYEIHLENYCKVTAIEAATLRDMTLRGILPAVTRYTGDLAKGVVRKRQAEMTTSCRVESYLVTQLDALSGDLLDACQAMSRALEAAPAADAGIDAARYYRDQVASRLEEMRSIIDRMEPLVGADYWPYPTYADILFSV